MVQRAISALAMRRDPEGGPTMPVTATTVSADLHPVTFWRRILLAKIRS